MTDNNMNQKRVAVIGGGAAGMMAAIHAAYMGAEVTLYEKNDRLGKKLRITGKGRCNVTNDSGTEEFLQNVPTNPRFLYAALNRFSTSDTQDFFEGCGVPLKVERGKRVFPVSDKASDIVRALADRMKDCEVKVVTDKITDIDIEDGRAVGVVAGDKKYPADAVIVCTGGKSYTMTGSDGDGYKFARRAGHTVTQLKPSLVPIVCEGKLCLRMQGLSLKNVTMKVVRKDNGKCVYEDFGEMMFTHFGITGPMVLSASAHLPDISDKIYEAHIDLKPALDEAALDARIRSDFAKYNNNNYSIGIIERHSVFFEDYVINTEDISGTNTTILNDHQFIWINDKIYFARIYENKLYISSCDIYGENLQNEILFTEDICVDEEIYRVEVYKYTMYIQYKTANYSKNNKNAIKIGSYNFETGEKQLTLASGQEYNLSDFYPKEYNVEVKSSFFKEDYLMVTKTETNETYTINRDYFNEYEFYDVLVEYDTKFKVASGYDNILYVAGEINTEHGCNTNFGFVVLRIDFSTKECELCGLVEISEVWTNINYMFVLERMVI